MTAIKDMYRRKKSPTKASSGTTIYYGIKRTVGYFPSGTMRYVDVRPICDDFDEPPIKQDTRGTSDGRTYITWFDTKKQRDAILRKIQDGIFIGWDPKGVNE